MTEALSAAIERAARNALRQHYDFSDRTRFSLLSESENKVYLIDDPDSAANYVMRVNSGRLAYHTPASIASELMWLMALGSETDIVVPKVKAARDGSLVVTLSATDLDKPRHASVYSFLPGVEPPEDDLLPGFRRLGEISAGMHNHAKAWTPAAAFKRHAWSPDAILDDRLDWGRWQNGVEVSTEVERLLTRVDRTVRRRLGALPQDRNVFGLIHADLRLANLLVQGDTTAIIDFDDCGFGWYLFDLAGALSFLEERADAPDLIASWLEGYRTVSQVPAEVEAEIPTLIVLRRLQLMGWVGYQKDRLDFAREIGPTFTRDSCRLADDYLSEFG